MGRNLIVGRKLGAQNDGVASFRRIAHQDSNLSPVRQALIILPYQPVRRKQYHVCMLSERRTSTYGQNCHTAVPKVSVGLRFIAFIASSI